MPNLNTSDFYQRLPILTNAAEIAFEHHYQSVPDDWWLVLTDVRGSTQAIQEGRYKEVNTVGAAGIIAVQNALSDKDFPFVFGGDGASLLIHDSDLEVTKGALAHTREVAKSQFGFELRIALVPIRELNRQGREVRLAKFELSPDNHIALFHGGGLSLAEKLMKMENSSFLLSPDQAQLGEHTGLECRWNPIPTRKSHILALIVQTREHISHPSQVYSGILKEILAGGEEGIRPITLQNLPISWPPQNLHIELKTRFKSTFQRIKVYVGAMAFTALAYVVLKFKKSDEKSEPGRYVHQLIKNTDFLKFDDCLRMIIDVSPEQMKRISSVLEAHLQKNEIHYGLHSAPNALMTCFVQNPRRHIHFVDADLGGYAMAAKMLKAQKAKV